MEERKYLLCYKCGGQVTIDNKQLGTCEECESLIPLPAIIKNKETINNLEYVEKAMEKINAASRSQSNYTFHHAFNTYDRVIKINRSAQYEDYYPYWGKVLAQYGVVYRLNKKLENVPINMRVNYRSIYNNPYYQKALEYADLNAQVLLKKEAAIIEENQKAFLKHLVNFKPIDILICVDDSRENPNSEQDLAIAFSIETIVKKLNLSYRITYQDFVYHNLENWHKDPLASIETTDMMIVISTDPNHLKNNLFKNMWHIFYKDQLLKTTIDNRLLIITDTKMPNETFDIDRHFLLDYECDFITVLEPLIKNNIDVLKKFNEEIIENEIHYPYIESLLAKGEFERAQEQIKEAMNSKEDEYSLYRLSFLAKKRCQNEAEIITKIIDARNDLNYLNFYVLAPRMIKRKYYQYLELFLEKVETLEEIDVEYEKEVNIHQRKNFQKNLLNAGKYLLLTIILTVIFYLTASIANIGSVIVVISSLTILYGFTLRLYYKNIGLGKLPEELKNEIDIKKYYHKIRKFLPPDQGSALLANPYLKKMKFFCHIILAISILSTLSFFVKEAVVKAEYPNLEYKYRFDKVIITGGKGREIVIPTTIGGREVIEIDDNAFYQNSELEIIEISFGIKKIGSSAFAKCPNLKEVILPISLESVGSDAPFAGCIKLSKLFCPGKILTSNKIGNIFQILGANFNEEMPDLEIIG